MAAFVALFTALAAVVALSASIVDLIADDEESSASPFEDEFESEGAFGGDIELSFGGGDDRDADDKAIDAAVTAVIGLVVAGAIYLFHAPRLQQVDAVTTVGSGAWRVRRSYRLVTCFAAVAIVLVTATVALHGVWSLAAPGIAGAGDRGDVIEGLVPVLVLLAGAALIFRFHWDGVEPAPAVTAEAAP
jgi:hypothetical protein